MIQPYLFFIKYRHIRYPNAPKSRIPKMPKMITPISCLPLNGAPGVGVGAGLGVEDGVAVGTGVRVGAGVSEGLGVGVGGIMLEAVRFTIRLSPVSQVPASSAV